MRRLFLLSVGLAALLLAPTVAVGAGPYESATGSGTETFDGRSFDFSFSAHNGPHGPKGRVVLEGIAMPPLFTGGDIKVHGPVDCLVVSGAVANIIFTVAKTNSDVLPVGTKVGWSVIDDPNGDWSGWYPATAGHINVICNGGIATGAGGRVADGGVHVRDVP